MLGKEETNMPAKKSAKKKTRSKKLSHKAVSKINTLSKRMPKGQEPW
jgi:hypothetical protein